MDKDQLLVTLASLESSIDFSIQYKITDLIELLREISDKSSFDVSQFIITKSVVDIHRASGEDFEKTTFKSLDQVVGIDYDYVNFLYNNELYVDQKDEDGLNYWGRRLFNGYSYYSADVLCEKALRVLDERSDVGEVERIFEIISSKCFPKMGGYAAMEICFDISTAFLEKGLLKESVDWYYKIEKFRSDISDSTVASFYKLAAELFLDKNLNEEALLMIDKGLSIDPKLSVKKIRSKILKGG